MTDETTECNEQAAALTLHASSPAPGPGLETPTEYTPPAILEAAHEVLGCAIDLDPASSDAQQELSPVKAARYHTVDDEVGLTSTWRGRVWFNPPYARGWIRSLRRQDGSVLPSGRHGRWHPPRTNSATETKWWRMAVQALVTPYVSHWPASGFSNCATRRALSRGGSSPSHPHTLFYFGPDPSTFAKVFDRFGPVFPKPLGKEGKPI